MKKYSLKRIANNTNKAMYETKDIFSSFSSSVTHHRRWALVLCYQQFEKGSCCFKRAFEVSGGLSYIDDIKVVLWRKAINACVGKSAFRIELSLKGSCEDKHCVRTKNIDVMIHSL